MLRFWLGKILNYKETSDWTIACNPTTHGIGVVPQRFGRGWESRNRMLIGVQAVEGEVKETKDLTTAQRRRGRDGRKAIRQIEMERQRLGRELHTGVGQMLAAIHLHVEVISAALPSPPANVGHALSRISTLAEDSLRQVRDISRRLHPPEWQRLTLESAIRQLWEVSGVPQRFEASLQIHPLPWEPALEAKILIYRGLQEALSNLVRHSRAAHIAVALDVSDGQLVLSVRDDGVGFDERQAFSAPASVASGIGLRSIRETAQELGGKLEVKSGTDGTTIVVSVAPFPVES